MDYSYLNQAGFDSTAMSTLQSAAVAAASSEANFYGDLGSSCPSSAMMPGNYGSLGSRYHSSVMRSAYGAPPAASAPGMPTPSGSPSACGVIPRSTPDHHRQAMFGAAGMGLNSEYSTLSQA